jgi:hypothetical protein
MIPATRAGFGRLEARRISPFMRASTAAKILREQHGEAEARKLALRELQSARRALFRARSRIVGSPRRVNSSTRIPNSRRKSKRAF